MYNLLKQPAAEFVELTPISELKPAVNTDTVAARLIMNNITIELCNGITGDTVTAIIRGLSNPEDKSHNWALLLMPENAPDECRTKINR